MSDTFEIDVGDVTDMEAHVFARYRGDEAVTLRGTVRGPYCENVRTLPADFEFHPLHLNDATLAEAVVIDPCLWSPEMPQLYRVDVRAVKGEQILAEFHGSIGLERLAPRRPVDFAPGTG
jgi:hypothetical protein